MSDGSKMSVAVPWSLSHYIPLNGFHPLYRALFDHAPSHVTCLAWDSVNLDRRLASDSGTRNTLLHKIQVEEHRRERSSRKDIEKTYQEYFWAPNHVLTSELPGDIEFHHTAPFPSLHRPFVFHCEMFGSMWMPFSQQGSGLLQKPEKIKEFYKRIFNTSLCLGIFSHIPETIHGISRFFKDPSIDRKLFHSRIGLSARAVSDLKLPKKSSIQRPRFLFVNSANQNPDNFFRRGGHIVLRFWEEFLGSGRDGLLMVRCARPTDQKLLEYGVDLAMVQAEIGNSILWGQDYLTNDEMNALMANSNFFLLPSMSLHSVSIMQAMTFGAIPVITDTVGTSVYVKDGENGIVLKGMREAIWYQDEATGVLVDSYKKTPGLDASLVSQLTSRILGILNTPEIYETIRNRTLTQARNHFSGGEFGAQFWGKVEDLFQKYKSSCSEYQSNFIQGRGAMIDCTIQGEGWKRVFESPTQPLKRINTGHSVIFEMGGAMVHAYGNPSFELNDWSILAKYSISGAPQTTFTNTLEELNGCFLSSSKSSWGRFVSEFVGWCSRILKPYPTFHKTTAYIWKKIRRYHFKIVSNLSSLPKKVPDIELVQYGVAGYNIFRHGNRYFAILQNEGAFVSAKAEAGGYFSCISGDSIEEVLDDIVVSNPASLRMDSNENLQGQVELVLEGFQGFNIVRCGDQFHAVLQSQGDFDPEKLFLKNDSNHFSGCSIDEVRGAILSGLGCDQTVKQDGTSNTGRHQI